MKKGKMPSAAQRAASSQAILRRLEDEAEARRKAAEDAYIASLQLVQHSLQGR
jgi:hypothetical protein